MAKIDAEAIKQELAKYMEIELLKDALADLQKAFSFKKLFALIMALVHVAERVVADIGEVGSGAGEEKKKAVIQFLDDQIKLPFYLELIDGKIIGFAIDGLIIFYNTWYGKKWFDVVGIPPVKRLS